MTTEEMRGSCIHKGHCAAAFAKDHWCGNWTNSKTLAMVQLKRIAYQKCNQKRLLNEGEDDMQKCPKCGRGFPRLLALSREDNKTMICDDCGIREAIGEVPSSMTSPQEKTRAAVYATGNRWAIENYEATHN